MFRILAIEPDPERGKRLTRLVRDRVGGDVVLASSTEAAIAAMSERAPDLILTSALLAPQDDSVLTAYLKERDGARDVPVLTVPPIVDVVPPPTTRSRWPAVFQRRAAPPWPAFDEAALGARIEEALRASTARGPARPGVSPVVAYVDTTATDPESIAAAMAAETLLLEHCGLGVKRARAHRWERTDLPWLSTVNLPWGLEVELLNISSTGLLMESGSKLIAGSATAFHLSGQNKSLIVAARIVRSHVAVVSPRGVRYRAAAVFDRALDLLTQRPASHGRSISTPKALTDLLAHVVDQLQGGADPASVRAAFQQGLRRLVRARDIQLRDVPDVPKDGGESVCFNVGSHHGLQTILQATFEPNYRPEEEEFRILKGAATLAEFILQFEDVSPGQSLQVIPPAAVAVAVAS